MRVVDALEELLDREAENRVHGAWLDLAERLENETALMHAWMRNLASGPGDPGVTQHQKIDVDEPWATGDRAFAPHRPLDRAADLQDRLRLERRFTRRRRVEEPARAGGLSDWLRLPARGHPVDREAGIAQALDGFFERPLAIADAGAEREMKAGHVRILGNRAEPVKTG
jgi:hypothetical protein